MHHVQNTCSDRISFANESRHEHARTLISRTCGLSPTHIDNWYVAPEKWHHKQMPKETSVTRVNTWRCGRGHHIKEIRRHLVRPFRQHAFRDQDIRNAHDVRSRAACLSQELAAENSRGAWARICLISPTQTPPVNKFSVRRYYRQSGDQTLRLPCRTHAVARNGLKSSPAVAVPLNFHTSKRKIVKNGCRPHGSSCLRTSQSNARSSLSAKQCGALRQCERSIRPRTCCHISYCRNMSQAEVL